MHANSGMLDPASAATMKAALAPLLERLGPEDDRTAAQRCADGLITLAEIAMNIGELPEHGGEKPQAIASLLYTDLVADIERTIGAASLNGIDITRAPPG